MTTDREVRPPVSVGFSRPRWKDALSSSRAGLDLADALATVIGTGACAGVMRADRTPVQRVLLGIGSCRIFGGYQDDQCPWRQGQ